LLSQRLVVLLLVHFSHEILKQTSIIVLESGKTVFKEVATLRGGCFWCTEAVFSEIKGVLKVEPGYSGGSLANPTHEQVSTGTTGHAEVVQITFDSSIISFREILKVFFATHDPTTLNR
jgi:peptide-methionine (S)-S-oxide reductase